jgi:hypothetical protein
MSSDTPSPENFRELLEDFIAKNGKGQAKNLSDLLALVQKSKNARKTSPPPTEGKKPESDCPEDVEDCSDVISPCCNVPVSTVFGTLPLKVCCKGCGKEYLLGMLMRNLLRKPKTTDAV